MNYQAFLEGFLKVAQAIGATHPATYNTPVNPSQGRDPKEVEVAAAKRGMKATSPFDQVKVPSTRF